MNKPYGIYLSSTLDDLQAEREAVTMFLAKEGFSIKQSYSAHESNLIESCLDDVKQCAVYIGIIGMRYGYQPPDGGGKSITELEFEEALRSNVAPYVFIKDAKKAYYMLDDADANRDDLTTGIGAFRARLSSGKEVRPGLFATQNELMLAVAARMEDFKRHIRGNKLIMTPKRTNAAELTHDVALVMVPGTDEAAYRRYLPLCNDNRFKIVLVPPDEPAYLRHVDKETRSCRCACWVLSAQSITRFAPALLKRAAEVCRFRFGAAFVMLIEGATPERLDAAWGFEHVPEIAGATDEQQLEGAYSAIRARVRQIFPDRRIAIPAMVLALTHSEAQMLADNADQVMSAFVDESERATRTLQFNKIRTAMRPRHPSWPAGFYGASREDWRPFGPERPTATSLLARAIDRLNDSAQRSGRDRLLLAGEDVKLQVRPYNFDEYIDDCYGTRGNLDSVRDQGCLFLVDEMALLHPVLRQWAHQFLSGQRVAVMSANPCDPAFMPIADLLHDFSFLHVGIMRERFRVAHDPRCELAVNSIERMERWLTLVLPELVPALGQLEPQADLRDRMFT